MAEALTRKQAIAAVWQKFMGVIGYADISGIGDGTVKGAIAGLNGNYAEYNYDNAVCQDTGIVTGNVISIPETGTYLIWASAKNNTTSKSGFTELSVVANGILCPLDTVSHEGNQVICTGIYMGKLQSGQTVYHRVFQNGGFPETISDRYLRMIKLK